MNFATAAPTSGIELREPGVDAERAPRRDPRRTELPLRDRLNLGEPGAERLQIDLVGRSERVDEMHRHVLLGAVRLERLRDQPQLHRTLARIVLGQRVDARRAGVEPHREDAPVLEVLRGLVQTDPAVRRGRLDGLELLQVAGRQVNRNLGKGPLDLRAVRRRREVEQDRDVVDVRRGRSPPACPR